MPGSWSTQTLKLLQADCMTRSNKKQTSTKVSKLASRVLKNPKSSKTAKSLDGSALSQARKSED